MKREYERKSARDVGAESPPSKAARQQSIAGTKGGPREAQQRGTGRQPPQTSNRRSKRHEQAPTATKSLEPERDPAHQGRGEPRARTIRQNASQQGLAGGRGSRPRMGQS